MADARSFETKATLATLGVAIKECMIMGIVETCRVS